MCLSCKKWNKCHSTSALPLFLIHHSYFMFHHLTFPTALRSYIELHTHKHTHTCLILLFERFILLFERFTVTDRSSLYSQSLWNGDNSETRGSWEVRGPRRESRNSLQILSHRMGTKKGDNEKWVGCARMLFRKWKGGNKACLMFTVLIIVNLLGIILMPKHIAQH